MSFFKEHSPFFRLESGRWISWDEKKSTHWVHVTKCWKKTHTHTRVKNTIENLTLKKMQITPDTYAALLQPSQ